MAITGRARLVAGSALVLSVATQIFYITVVSDAGPETALRPATWMSELAIFTGLALASFLAAVRTRVAQLGWVALVIAGLVNMVQVGMGLAMFGPAQEAGEGVFAAVLSGAFFFYFLGKALIGIAAIDFGRALVAARGTMAKTVGAVALLGGLAATGLNALAILAGRDWTFAAGGAGTAAALILAIAILLSRDDRDMAA